MTDEKEHYCDLFDLIEAINNIREDINYPCWDLYDGHNHHRFPKDSRGELMMAISEFLKLSKEDFYEKYDCLELNYEYSELTKEHIKTIVNKQEEEISSSDEK